jgi:putative oxidoreductase
MEKNNLFTKVLTNTSDSSLSTGILFIRLTIGILLFIAGSGKALAWFGGYGAEKSLGFYNQMGFSNLLGYLSIYTEFIGGLLLVTGLFTRFAAFALTINMAVATIVSLPRGFMGPTGAQTPFIFLVCIVVIMITGPMIYSIDYMVFKHKQLRN